MGAAMRGSDAVTGALFSYVDLEDRVPADHPLRVIRAVVNEVLRALDADFGAMYSDFGRQSIPPERLLRGSLIQAFYTVRSERQLMEQLDYNLLFRWFVGLGIDDAPQRRLCLTRRADGGGKKVTASALKPMAPKRKCEAFEWKCCS